MWKQVCDDLAKTMTKLLEEVEMGKEVVNYMVVRWLINVPGETTKNTSFMFSTFPLFRLYNIAIDDCTSLKT